MVHPDSGRVPRVPPYSGTCSPPFPISLTGLSPSVVELSNSVQLSVTISFMHALQPHLNRSLNGLGSSLFAHRYWGNLYWFLFLRVLRCFSSPGLLSLRNDQATLGQVSLFGDLRVKACLRLTEAYRSFAASFIASKRQGILRMPLVT